MTTAPPTVSRAPAATHHEPAREPIDVLAALADGTRDVAWIIPGAAQLELGGAPVQAPDGADPLEVVPLDERGNDVRVGVRLDHARFALWTQRARLLAIVLRDQRVAERPGGGFTPISVEPIEARVRATALVRRIAHQKTWTKIRYSGALEINGWVPDDALGDRTRAGKQPLGRIPTGRTTLAVFPGAVIRSEPQWGSRELAVMATGYFIDEVTPVDDAWSEVAYEDGDVAVHGYLSRRDPPGRVHRPREADPIVPAQTNATAPGGTCLYASENGEAIGFVVGDSPVALEPTHPGWFSLVLDTPWGPIAFAARGATENELATCAPTSP
ncbi:MAG: hypothetical protein JO257_03940 [Deltaproteobacteria bacterium]|nr:hypothetical protein [Deltaproteobacteria bacterium]